MRPFSKLSVWGALVAGGLALSAGQFANAVENNPDDVATAQADVGLDNAACVAGGGDLVNGTTDQAKHSAEATAHKTLNDPNNQLGTSLQGRTRGPVNCVTTALADTSRGEALD